VWRQSRTRGSGADEGVRPTGHAFVLWGVEDHIRRRTTIQAFGLYPESGRGNCGSLVRNVPGGLLDEMKDHSLQAITQELIVRVDEADCSVGRSPGPQPTPRRPESLVGHEGRTRGAGADTGARREPQVNRPPAVFP
jgi:hypothetical protein